MCGIILYLIGTVFFSKQPVSGGAVRSGAEPAFVAKGNHRCYQFSFSFCERGVPAQ
jgi:hypothetical protein